MFGIYFLVSLFIFFIIFIIITGKIELPLQIKKVEDISSDNPEVFRKKEMYHNFLTNNGFVLDSIDEVKPNSATIITLVNYLSLDGFISASIAITRINAYFEISSKFTNGLKLILSDFKSTYYEDNIIFLYKELLPKELLKEHLALLHLINLEREKYLDINAELIDELNNQMKILKDKKLYFSYKNYLFPSINYILKFLLKSSGLFRVNKDKLLKKYAPNHEIDIITVNKTKLFNEFIKNNDVKEESLSIKEDIKEDINKYEELILKEKSGFGDYLNHIIGILFLGFMFYNFFDIIPNVINSPNLKSFLLLSPFIFFIMYFIKMILTVVWFFIHSKIIIITKDKVVIKMKILYFFKIEKSLNLCDFKLIDKKIKDNKETYYQLKLINKKNWFRPYNTIILLSTKDYNNYNEYMQKLETKHFNIYEKISTKEANYKPLILEYSTALVILIFISIIIVFRQRSGFITKNDTLFLSGKLYDGLKEEYYRNGYKKLEANFKNGKLDGVSTFYYKNGRKKEEKLYKNGKLMNTTKWNISGEVVK